MTWSDAAPVAAVYAGVLALWFACGRRLGRIGFYALFAISVTASVQLVGIYLVFGTLILPALAVQRLPARHGLAVAYCVGLAGYLAGFVATTALDLPAGPVIVCALAVSAGVAAFAAWRFCRA